MAKAKAKAKAKPKSKAKSKAKPKKPSRPKPKAKPKADAKPASDIEAKVAALLKSDADGDIDNVYDILTELQEYDEQLPKTSPLRPRWNAFVSSCEQIVMEVPLGEG